LNLTYFTCLADILNYALTLEHLEATFYEEGLKNYTHKDFLNAGFKDPFYSNLQVVASDEKAHEDFLTGALSGESQLKHEGRALLILYSCRCFPR
jgi:hypothetical protein